MLFSYYRKISYNFNRVCKKRIRRSDLLVNVLTIIFMKMDAQLQQLFKIRPQQANCIAYRTSTDVYNKMLKKTCTSELKNLINVEIAVEQVELKTPDPRKIPPLSPLNAHSHLEVNSKVAQLLEEANIVKQYLELL